MDFFSTVRRGQSKNRLDFGGNPVLDPDRVILS